MQKDESRDNRGGTFTVGGPIDEVSVTLGIHGDDLDPDEVTSILGRNPTAAHRRGDLHSKGRGVRRRGAWLLSVRGKSPTSPASLLNDLLDLVTSEPEAWASLLRRFDVGVGFGLLILGWNRGFDLPHATLRRLVALGLSVDFDVYSDDPVDET